MYNIVKCCIFAVQNKYKNEGLASSPILHRAIFVPKNCLFIKKSGLSIPRGSPSMFIFPSGFMFVL